VPTDVEPFAVAVDYLGRFAYTANYLHTYQGDVSGYTINQTTWELTPTSPPTFQAGMGPYDDLIDPSGRFVYVTNFYSSGTGVSAYAIDQSTGTLTHIMDATTGPGPSGIASDPWGRFLYTANFEGGGISTFAINSVDGTLTSVPSNPTTGKYPAGIAVAEAAGHLFAYVTDESTGPGTVYCYTVNPVTGVLTFTGFNIAAGSAPGFIATDPSGRFAYVVNAYPASVSEYSIDPTTGDLIAVGTVGLPDSELAVAPAVDITGHFLYVTNNESVVVYGINQTTGALTGPSQVVSFPGFPWGAATYGTWY